MKNKILIGFAALVIAMAMVGPGLAQETQPNRKTAQERVEAIKQESQQRRAQVKQDVCQRRQAHIKKALPRLANNVMVLKGVLDKMYTRVQGFYASGKLTVANYDELKAAIDAAKADAETAIAAVDSFQFTFDCDNPSVGNQLDSFRSAIKEAREALKDYRSALVNLISALKSAAAEDKDDTEAN